MVFSSASPLHPLSAFDFHLTSVEPLGSQIYKQKIIYYRYPMTAAIKTKNEILQTPNKGYYTTTKMIYSRNRIKAAIKAATLQQK